MGLGYGLLLLALGLGLTTTVFWLISIAEHTETHKDTNNPLDEFHKHMDR